MDFNSIDNSPGVIFLGGPTVIIEIGGLCL
jgi:hypothetical protein